MPWVEEAVISDIGYIDADYIDDYFVDTQGQEQPLTSGWIEEAGL